VLLVSGFHFRECIVVIVVIRCAGESSTPPLFTPTLLWTKCTRRTTTGSCAVRLLRVSYSRTSTTRGSLSLGAQENTLLQVSEKWASLLHHQMTETKYTLPVHSTPKKTKRRNPWSLVESKTRREHFGVRFRWASFRSVRSPANSPFLE